MCVCPRIFIYFEIEELSDIVKFLINYVSEYMNDLFKHSGSVDILPKHSPRVFSSSSSSSVDSVTTRLNAPDQHSVNAERIMWE